MTRLHVLSIATVKVYHCAKRDGPFDGQNGSWTHSVRQCKFNNNSDGDRTFASLSKFNICVISNANVDAENGIRPILCICITIDVMLTFDGDIDIDINADVKTSSVKKVLFISKLSSF